MHKAYRSHHVAECASGAWIVEVDKPGACRDATFVGPDAESHARTWAALLDRDPALVERVARAIRFAESLGPTNQATAALTALMSPPSQEAKAMDTTNTSTPTHADPNYEPTPPPPSVGGEIGPEWLPPGVVQTIQNCPERDNRWRTALRTERAAREKAERERDEVRAALRTGDTAAAIDSEVARQTEHLQAATSAALSKMIEANKRAATAEAKLAEAEKKAAAMETWGSIHDKAGNLLGAKCRELESDRDRWRTIATRAEEERDSAKRDADARVSERLMQADTDAATLAALRDPDAGMVDEIAKTVNSRDAGHIKRVLAAALAHAGEKPKGETGEMDKMRAAVYAVWKGHSIDTPIEVLASAVLALIDKARRSP